MKNLALKIKKARLRKLPVLLALAATLVVPTAIRAYAVENPEESSDDGLVVANLNVEGELEAEDPTEQTESTEPTEPTPEDVEEPTTPEEEEVVEDPVEEPENTEDDEDPIVGDPVDDLQRYIDFAKAEHPDVEITGVVYVWKHGVKTVKFTFADGWTVYIGVSDGSTVKVADTWGQVKKCQKRVRHGRAFERWYLKYQSYYEWWVNHQNGQAGMEAELGDNPSEEDQTDDEQVEGASTDNYNKTYKRKSWYTPWGQDR